MGASGSGVGWVTSPFLLYTGIVIAVLIVVCLLVLLIFVRKAGKECHETIAKRFKDKDIICKDNSANFFGRVSFKNKQVRGNGILILTKDELFFTRVLPKMEISISLKNVQSIETSLSFLGKSIHKPLLKINYYTENSETDSIAWYVKDIEKFKIGIESQVKTT